jgi:hypothetical protein
VLEGEGEPDRRHPGVEAATFCEGGGAGHAGEIDDDEGEGAARSDPHRDPGHLFPARPDDEEPIQIDAGARDGGSEQGARRVHPGAPGAGRTALAAASGFALSRRAGGERDRGRASETARRGDLDDSSSRQPAFGERIVEARQAEGERLRARVRRHRGRANERRELVREGR